MIIVVHDNAAVAENCFLQLLIEDPDAEDKRSIPKALQTVFTVFHVSNNIHIIIIAN